MELCVAGGGDGGGTGVGQVGGGGGGGTVDHSTLVRGDGGGSLSQAEEGETHESLHFCSVVFSKLPM